MKITRTLTTPVVLQELGRRLARTRLNRNLTQEEVARDAGVGLATLERLEAGRSVQLTTFIRVLRVLDLVDGLDLWLPESGPNPIALLKLMGKQRRRASGKRKPAPPPPNTPWKWGDER